MEKADVVEFDHLESCDVKFRRKTQMLMTFFQEELLTGLSPAPSVSLVRWSPAEVALFSLAVRSSTPVEGWMGKAAEAA